MSYSRTKNTKSQGTKTPFCKICFDLGKPKSVYTSHYVRKTPHIDSMITCPVLLANVCRHCHMTGHFTGSCPKAKREERERRKERFAEERQRRKQEEKRANACVESLRRKKNVFAALDEDSDDENEDIVRAIVVKPVSTSDPVKKRIINWAYVDSDTESEDEE